MLYKIVHDLLYVVELDHGFHHCFPMDQAKPGPAPITAATNVEPWFWSSRHIKFLVTRTLQLCYWNSVPSSTTHGFNHFAFPRLYTNHPAAKMPPKRIYVEKSQPKRAPKGFVASTYETLTSSDNAAVVRSVAMFGVSSCAVAG